MMSAIAGFSSLDLFRLELANAFNVIAIHVEVEPFTD